jgi:hypothetical protein
MNSQYPSKLQQMAAIRLALAREAQLTNALGPCGQGDNITQRGSCIQVNSQCFVGVDRWDGWHIEVGTSTWPNPTARCESKPRLETQAVDTSDTDINTGQRLLVLVGGPLIRHSVTIGKTSNVLRKNMGSGISTQVVLILSSTRRNSCRRSDPPVQGCHYVGLEHSARHARQWRHS